MIDISIREELKKACPTITLGCIQSHVTVANSSVNLLKEIDDYCDVLKAEIHIEELSDLSQIKAGRDVYKRLGKAPSKYS